MVRMRFFVLTAALVLILSACTDTGNYERFDKIYLGQFDTYITFIAFARSQYSFDTAADAVRAVIELDGKLFDIYNEYEGMNNLKTINDNAGILPVPVDDILLDLLEFAVEVHELTDGVVNVAIGPVLRIWHEYRTKDDGTLPSLDLLRKHAAFTNIDDVMIDRQNGTVFLVQEGMSLDVGAIAKGFTARRVLEAAKASGITSALINMGGDVATTGKPMDGRDRWAIGINNPFLDDEGRRGIMDTVYVNDMALASSGNYERFYIVDGISYSHIIDPETLFPAMNFAGVTVLHPDAALAEALSTALFILPLSQGRKLLDKVGAQGMWVTPDGAVETTTGYDAMSQKQSGYSAFD